MVLGEVKEVEVGVVNTHLATWYSETEAKWSQVMGKNIKNMPYICHSTSLLTNLPIFLDMLDGDNFIHH